jgi:hypothetical protein
MARAAALLLLLPGGPGESRSTFLLLHDWFGDSPAATPALLRERRAFLETLPFDGVAVYVRTPDLSLNVTAAVLGREAVPYASMARALAPLRGVEFRNLRHNFAAVVGGTPPDFFDDWTPVVRNFGNLARAAREAGLVGIAFDNESYGAPWADYPEGVAYPRRSLDEYRAQARARGRRVMEAVVAEFPEAVVLSFHGPYVSEPKAPAPLFPAWQGSNELLGPFFAGFVEGAGRAAACVDGGELYHLRSEEEFRGSYEWRKRSIAGAAVDSPNLPPAVRRAWAERVSVAFGVYDRPFGGRDMDPDVLRATLSRALRHADRYVWLYPEGRTFLAPPEGGGAAPPWVSAVREARK